MANSKIIHLNLNGPNNIGLTKLELDQADFQSDLPEQHWHIYYENPELGLTIGVWTTTTMQEKFGPYPGDEFMCILEGQVAMVDEKGNETLIREGETFCVHNAFPISWKQNGFLRKFFFTYNRTDGATPEIISTDDGIINLKQTNLVSDLQILESHFPFEFEGNAPVQKDASVFVNDTKNMYAGMWESDPFESLMRPFPCHEFVQLLEGEISITEQEGTKHTFCQGDVFFIPAGTVCSWKTTAPVRKFYSMLLDESENGQI